MYYSQHLAINLLTVLTSAYAAAALSTVPGVKYVDIDLCNDISGYGTCTTFSTFVVTSTDNDRHITSNFGVQINTANVNGIQSVLVSGDDSVTCTFGNNLLSSTPSVMCGGWTTDIISNTPVYNFGNGENADAPLNGNVQCFYCSST